MSKALESVLVLHDVHRPYHDKRAWALLMKVGRWLQPDRIIVNGDFLDFYAVSSHSKDPARINNLQWEVEDGNKGLDDLDSLGADNKDWLDGNHCFRLKRYLQDKAPELFGLVDIPSLMKLKERGWSYTPYRKHKKIGKLHVTHDVGKAGRYSAYNALDAFQHSVITGHSHRLSYVVEGNAVGEHKLSAAFGWLGDINQVDYLHEVVAKKNWALGFGIGYIHRETGIAYLTPVPIVRYTCCVNGKLFEG